MVKEEKPVSFTIDAVRERTEIINGDEIPTIKVFYHVTGFYYRGTLSVPKKEFTAEKASSMIRDHLKEIVKLKHG